MTESWLFDDGSRVPVPPDALADALATRVREGHFETWLASSSGRLLCIVTNSRRAMVILLAEEGDAGEHATDPRGRGTSDGFVLANGQHDTYPDADTVPLPEACALVTHIVTTGSWPAHASWTADR